MQACHYQKVIAVLAVPKHRRVKFVAYISDFLSSDFYDESNVVNPRLSKGLLLYALEDTGLAGYV